jgi:hypothetical protein
MRIGSFTLRASRAETPISARFESWGSATVRIVTSWSLPPRRKPTRTRSPGRCFARIARRPSTEVTFFPSAETITSLVRRTFAAGAPFCTRTIVTPSLRAFTL